MPLSLSITSRFEHQQEGLAELIRGLTEKQLKERVNPDKWSAFEQLVHLVTYQPVFFQRVQLMEQQDNPAFTRYKADEDPVFHEYLSWSVPALLEDYSTRRFLINKHLIPLRETVLRRGGSHPVYGHFSMAQWADFFLLHEAHHLFAIFMLAAALRNKFQH